MRRPRDLDWLNRAACRDADPDLFFPEAGDHVGVGNMVYGRARAICAACPVIVECREQNDADEAAHGAFAIFGMYAGETPYERRARRRAVAV